MENLFTTDVIIDGQSKGYDVTFENDVYVFTPEDDGPRFEVRRSEDTWKVAGGIADIAQQQAVSALERYLLSQH